MSTPNPTDIVAVIVQTRDFCGDERAAARDWCAENGVSFSNAIFAAALVQADAEWRTSQIAAGAKVLSLEERAEAHRGLSRAA